MTPELAFEVRENGRKLTIEKGDGIKGNTAPLFDRQFTTVLARLKSQFWSHERYI